jgi:hypothetical protein
MKSRFAYLLDPFGSALVAGCVAILAVAACSSSSSSAPDDCAAAGECCKTLPGRGVDACTTQLDSAKAQSDSQAACRILLDGYHASGLCNGNSTNGHPPANNGDDGGFPLDGGASGDGGSGAQPSICSRYLACVSVLTPGALAGSLSAYGPNGTCWTSGAQIAATCTTACAQGVAQLHQEDATACPLCASDAECAGNPAGPACDSASGTCVTCTNDTHCKATHQHCDPEEHACVECTSGSQCASGICTGSACCVPDKQCSPGDNCGTRADGCGGDVSCGGPCALGSCDSNRCTTRGVACTPGKPGQCAAGEKCMPDGWHQDYRCASTETEGRPCSSFPTDTCEDNSGSEPVDDYSCDGSKCAQNCLTNADCNAGKTCTPFLNNPISPSLPGQCL